MNNSPQKSARAGFREAARNGFLYVYFRTGTLEPCSVLMFSFFNTSFSCPIQSPSSVSLLNPYTVSLFDRIFSFSHCRFFCGCAAVPPRNVEASTQDA